MPSQSHPRNHRPYSGKLLLTGCVVGFAIAQLTVARAQDSSDKKRVIFLAGGPSHGAGLHEYRAGSLLLARALNEQSGLPVKAEVISGWPADASVLKGAAALVVYDTATKTIGTHMAEMDALTKAGMGVMFLHYAVHPSTKDGEAYYRPWTGGAFESGYSVNPFWIADLKPLPEHPVSRGISGPVRAHDEFYYNIRFRADRSQVIDLATATPTRENMVAVNNLWTQEGFYGLDKPQTLMWGTQRPDGGRGAGFTGGHFHRNWAIDDYRKLVLNAIVWVAGMEVPKGGVKSLPLTEDNLNENLDNKGRGQARITLPVPDDLAKLTRQPVPTPEEHRAKSAQYQESRKASKSGKKEGGKVEKKTTEESPPPVEVESVKPSEKPSGSNPDREAPVELKGDHFVPPSALKVPDDLEVTLWANSPMLFNPTNMDTDREGRIWVTEGVDYRGKKDRRPEGDRIMVLEDRDHDGRADQSHVFVQDPELVSPLGIAVFGNRIVVSQPPHLIVYTDVDGDLRFDPAKDKRENLLSGFFGRNHDHSLHAVVAGPDGRWYFNQGNTGADFTTHDGVNYKVGGPYGDAEQLCGKRSDDGRIWTGGFLASMKPDGTALRMLGHGFRNSYEHCLSSYGDIYQSDNDDPPACRNTWLMEGAFLGFFSRSGNRTWEAERRRGQSIPVAQWRQEDPGTLPPGDVYGRGSPTGVAFYENGALPAKYQGVFLSADARLQNIFGYQPSAEGAGKKLERFDFLTTKPGTQFRPSDVMVGADGAVYVADWYDPGVGGHGTRDDTLSGAIYRIAPRGFRPQVATAAVKGGPKFAAGDAAILLQSPAPNVRFEGFAALQSMARVKPGEVAPVLQKLLTDANPLVRARAVWLVPFLGQAGVDQVKQLLGDADPEKRVLALRALRNAGFDFKADRVVLEKVVTDPSPALRREAAVVLRDMPAEIRTPLVVKLFIQYDGKDRTYLEACGNAAEGIAAPVWEELRGKLAGSGPRTWTPAFARITWRLQPEKAIADVLSRALDPNLPFEDRKLAVDTIAFTRSRNAVEAMVKLRKAEPVIAEMATAWLLVRATDEWDEFGGRQVLKNEGIYDPEKVAIQEIKMPEPGPKRNTLDVKAIMELKGDAANGQNVAMRCTMCHRIDGQGVDYGPDLAGWAANQGVESFIKAVIDPSENIALGFEGQRITLEDGREVQGIVISAGDPLTVRSTGGVTQMIPRKLLDKRVQPLRRSLMLSGAELGLSAQDLADLAAFMKNYQ